MKVGACGICCDDACVLFTKNICQGCDPELVEHIPCPILKCAVDKNVQYCGRDCDDSPCRSMKKGFPYSEGYIRMLIGRMEAGQ